jgi:hypothetical protein
VLGWLRRYLALAKNAKASARGMAAIERLAMGHFTALLPNDRFSDNFI